MPDDIDADTLVAPIGACRTLARFNSLKDPSRGVTEAGETTADDAYEDAQGVVRTGRVTGSAVVILPVTRALEAICNGCEKLVATIVELLSSGGMLQMVLLSPAALSLLGNPVVWRVYYSSGAILSESWLRSNLRLRQFVL